MGRNASVERQDQIVVALAESLRNLFHNAARFHWEHSFLLKCIVTHIYHQPGWGRLSMARQSYLIGVKDQLFHQHWKLMEFSYEHKGKRLLLTDEEYRKIRPSEIDAKTGAYVYRNKRDKFFTMPGDCTRVKPPRTAPPVTAP